MYLRAKYVRELPGNRLAFIRPDFTLESVRERYPHETGDSFLWGATLVSEAELEAARAAFMATPRLTYQPERPALSVCIPFSGFYESLWSDLVDSEESSFAENEAEKQESAEYYPETFQPEHLRLDAGEIVELTMSHCDYRAAYQSIARDYVDSFIDWAEERLGDAIPGFGLVAEFEEMTSPREYNFATDRLFALIPYSCLAELFRLSEANGHGALAHIIRERFTSYDGFHSHYRNDVESWLEKPLDEWDHNELQTLLLAALALAEPDSAGERLDWQVYEHGDFSSHGHEYFDSAMDWAAYEAALEAARDEKLEAAIEAGIVPAEPEARPYRCPETPDLFAQTEESK